MRVLAAEDGVDLHHLALPGERFEIMRHRHQIGFRRQLVEGIAPIAVREDAELPALDEVLQLLLRVGEIAGARFRPARDRLRQLRRRRRIGLERGDDIHPVERMQMIEVHHMVVHILRGDHQIADQLRVGRDGVAQRVLHRAHAGDAVHQRAHPADALGEGPGVARIAVLQDQLDAAHHGAGAVGAGDVAGRIGFGLDAQMAFDAGDGIDDDAFVHIWAPRRL